MSSESFSFSVSLGSQKSADPTRLIARPFDSWPLAGGRRLLLCAGETEALTLPAAVVQALVLCDRFRNLDEHLAAVARRLPRLAADLPALQQSLLRLRETGVLVSEQQVFERLGGAAPAASGPRPELKTLYVRTCDRPMALARLLAGLPGPDDKHSGLRRVVVLDDARSAEAREKTRRTIDEFATRASPQLSVIDRPRRRALARRLARAAGVDPDHLDWCLNGDPTFDEPTYGCGYNLALLAAAGGHFALIDDDAELKALGESSEDGRLVLAAHEDRAVRYLESADPVDHEYRPATPDPIDELARFLGRTTGELIQNEQERLTGLLAGLDSAALHAFRPEARVRLAVCGCLGDPGTREILWQYLRPAAELQAWLADEATYERLATGRSMARMSPARYAYPTDRLMSALTSIDNTELLLPTLPQGRNEDLVFGQLAGYLYPGSLTVEHPWMVPHKPETPRRWNREALSEPHRPTAGKFIASRIGRCAEAVPPGSAAGRARLLATALQELAGAGPAELEAAFARELMSARSGVVEGAAETRAGLDLPDYLAADYERLIRANSVAHESDPDYIRSQAAAAGRMAAGYGAAVESWMAAWEYCRQQGEDRMLELAKGVNDE